MGTYAIEPHIVGLEKKQAIKQHVNDTYLLTVEMGAQQQGKDNGCTVVRISKVVLQNLKRGLMRYHKQYPLLRVFSYFKGI